MNEIANIAERVGADVEQVRQGIGSDPRIGWHFIYPGAGYGGSCFPKDVQALARTAQQHGLEPKLLNAVEAVNESQKGHLFALIQRHYDRGEDEGGRGKPFAVWGLAFKPNTDDMREASSRRLLAQLWEGGATVRAYDPEAMHESTRIFGERDDLVFCSSADDALQGADALVVVTEWKQFRSPDFQKLREQLKDAAAWPTTASAGGARCMSDLLPTEREQALEARLVELEMRVSFQEQALAELSDALADARMQGMRNADVLRVLLEDLGKVRNALNSSDPASEPPPPHY
ncbi:hypothetical protein G6F65_013544 [Rhizopus arrhizus]|nr:hypothetical protein G6F65_013544 [Rhizopus arrhizus]